LRVPVLNGSNCANEHFSGTFWQPDRRLAAGFSPDTPLLVPRHDGAGHERLTLAWTVHISLARARRYARDAAEDEPAPVVSSDKVVPLLTGLLKR